MTARSPDPISPDESRRRYLVDVAHNLKEHAMSATIKALGLERLSPAERILLAGELWESVAATPGISLLTDAHRADLQRRLEEYRDDPLAGSPWEEVKARLLGGGS